jgi:hypothetical protein
MIPTWLLLGARQLLRVRAFSCRPAPFTPTTQRTISMLVIGEMTSNSRWPRATAP